MSRKNFLSTRPVGVFGCSSVEPARLGPPLVSRLARTAGSTVGPRSLSAALAVTELLPAGIREPGADYSEHDIGTSQDRFRDRIDGTRASLPRRGRRHVGGQPIHRSQSLQPKSSDLVRSRAIRNVHLERHSLLRLLRRRLLAPPHLVDFVEVDAPPFVHGQVGQDDGG
jgi:hypothetical protein